MDKKIIVRADIPDDSDDRKDLVTNGLENGVSCFILRKGDKKFEDLGKMEAIYFENGIPCDFISNSMFVSYSNRSPLYSVIAFRYCAGIARRPVWVSEIFIPHRTRNANFVILFPYLLLNGTFSSLKSRQPKITL